MYDLIQDLQLVVSSFPPEDIKWLEDRDGLWKDAVEADGSKTPTDGGNLELSILLMRNPSPVEARIQVCVDGATRVIISGSQDREWQAKCNQSAKQILSSDGESLPIYTTIMALLEEATSIQVDQPLEPEAQHEESGPAILNTESSTTRIIFWSHHLLSTGKRRNIVDWCAELDLWGISRPGYPGVIIVEGPSDNVSAFTRRIKALRWQALNVRYEETISDSELASPRIARALHELKNVQRPSAVEVEDISEVHEIMVRAGMGELFLDVMKIRR